MRCLSWHRVSASDAHSLLGAAINSLFSARARKHTHTHRLKRRERRRSLPRRQFLQASVSILQHMASSPFHISTSPALILIAFASTSSAHVCQAKVVNPTQWKESEASGVTKCYGLLDDSMVDESETRMGCEHNCHYEGCQDSTPSSCMTTARIVRIRSRAENDAVLGLFSHVSAADKGKGIALGVMKQPSHKSYPNEWRFIGNGGDKRVPFTNWADGEPQSGGRAAILQTDGSWVAESTSAHDAATCVCEIQIDTFPPFPPAPPPPTQAPLIGGVAGGAAVVVVCLGFFFWRWLRARHRRRRAQTATGTSAQKEMSEPREAIEVTQPDGGRAVALGSTTV